MKLTGALLLFGLLGLWTQGLASRSEGRLANPKTPASSVRSTTAHRALVPRSGRDRNATGATEVAGEDDLVHADAKEVEKAR